MRTYYNLTGLIQYSGLRDNLRILINSAIISYNALHFNIICWFVVIRELYDLFASILRQYSPWISSISDITHIINNEAYSGARAWFIKFLPWLFKFLGLGKFKKQLLCLCKTGSNCLNRPLWEVVILNDQLVQIVSKEVSADLPTMAIVNAEKTTLRPFLTFWRQLFLLGPHDI